MAFFSGHYINDPDMVYYEFKELAGATIFADSSVNGINGKCIAGHCPTAGVAGKIDTALEFDGAGDYIQTADTTVLNPKNTFSAEVLIYPLANSATQVVLTKNFDYEMTLMNSGVLKVGITNSQGARVTKTMGGAIKLGEWNYVAMTYDGQKIRAYVNGKFIGEQAQTGNVRWSKGKPLSIGGYAASFPMKGKIDEAHLYSKVLTEEEILEEYNSAF